MPAFNYELASTILVEALFKGDEAAARKWGVTTRSLRNWRRRLAQDDRLAACVAEKKRIAEMEWADALAPAIRAGIEFLQRAVQTLDPGNPEAVHAAAGALKIMTEIAMTREVLDARIAGTGGAPHSAP